MWPVLFSGIFKGLVHFVAWRHFWNSFFKLAKPEQRRGLPRARTLTGLMRFLAGVLHISANVCGSARLPLEFQR